MKKVKQANEGFTLLESLIVMSFIALLSFVFMVPMGLKSPPRPLGIIDVQLEAMAVGQRVYLSDVLWFNGRGNINHAQTIAYEGLRCIFQLGMGRYRCE